MLDEDAIKSIDKVWEQMWSVGFNTAVFGPIEAVDQFEKSMVKCAEMCLLLIAARKSGMSQDEMLEVVKEVMGKLKVTVQ